MPQRSSCLCKASLANLDFYVQFRDMQELEHGDQLALIYANLNTATEFSSTSSINNKTNLNEYMKTARRFMRSTAVKEGTIEELEQRFAALDLPDNKDYEAVSYETVHTDLWSQCPEEGKRHKELMHAMGKWIGSDMVMQQIIVLLMLFATDNARLSNPKAVQTSQALQSKYNYMLYRYLKTKYSPEKAAKKFRESVYLTSMSREALHLRLKAENTADSNRSYHGWNREIKPEPENVA